MLFGGENLSQKLYEVMFLLDAAKGGADFPAAIQHVSGLLDRQEAVIERIEKWGERKLSYSIGQVERGIYLLIYARIDPARIAELRRDISLSEDVVRVLILEAAAIPEPTGDVYTPSGEIVVVTPPAEEPVPAPAADAEPAATGPADAEPAATEEGKSEKDGIEVADSAAPQGQ